MVEYVGQSIVSTAEDGEHLIDSEYCVTLLHHSPLPCTTLSHVPWHALELIMAVGLVVDYMVHIVHYCLHQVS